MNVMIIPAAGRGARLDYSGPKLMFPLGGKPLIAIPARTISAVC
ncbi:MAG: hypothetical protein GKR95_20855 [Gammaproteobacteria bacterium]|nr:hypothetical protein [Gammaproteobacteria bacterium]